MLMNQTYVAATNMVPSLDQAEERITLHYSIWQEHRSQQSAGYATRSRALTASQLLQLAGIITPDQDTINYMILNESVMRPGGEVELLLRGRFFILHSRVASIT